MERVKRAQIHFAEKDSALRKDVKRLGALVGELLREQSGEALFKLVESARRAAIDRREGDAGAETRLARLLQSLSPDSARDFVRAFSTYFQVVNTAEKVHRIRRRRDYLNDLSTPQPGGWEAMLLELRTGGFDLERVAALIATLRIEPVFTAHPTEPTRRTILRKQQAIVRTLIEMLDPTLTPQETRACLARIRLEVTSIWQTEEHPSEGMKVSDELEHVLFFLTDVIYLMLPAFYEGLEDALATVYGDAAREVDIPIMLQFGSWVGGDMDGNPNVTAKTIRETLARHRSLVLDLYYRECLGLAHKLSQTRSRIGVSPGLLKLSEKYSARFPHALHSVPTRHRDMPYRVYLRLVAERLQSTYDDGIYPYERADQFVADIQLLADSLEVNKGANAGLFAVRRLLRRAGSFGFHLASLDVRQDALVHRQVVAECLAEPDWMKLTAAQRGERLAQAISGRELPELIRSPLAKKTIAVFQAIAFCQRKYGQRAIGHFIISMTQGADDILSVLYLAQVGELINRQGAVPLDIAPLFETVEDLENGPPIIRSLLDEPVYHDHLERRRRRQTVMVGYSDSNKDGGLASARWSLQQAQEALVQTLDSSGIDLTIFHGRGGTISRGGGKIHAAVLGSPPGAVRGRLRVTEQGEMINEKYGLRGIAIRTLEQALSTVALATAQPRTRHQQDEHWHAIMRTMGDVSRNAYKSLVYDTPEFFSYFRNATPIDVIERMSIGSRPVARREMRGIEDLRAIPWVFAWTQSRHVLPGWYGFGTGLAACVERYGEQSIREMIDGWYFFQALVADVEMVLAKADVYIARQYSALAEAEHDHFFPIISREFELTVELVLKLRGQERLLENDGTLRRAIRLRNPYVDPMSLLQVELLRRWRESERGDEELFSALLASVNGIAHGLQNTG